MKNNLFENIMNMISSLSFYAPLIICFSVITFSILSGTIEKALVFFVWIFVITFIRVIVLKGSYLNKDIEIRLPDKCLIGLTDMFIPQDVTYSTYILTFTMMYLIMPMIMISKQNNINGINYGILGFFIAYVMLDLFVKSSLGCVSGLLSSVVIGNVLSGIFLGSVISGLIMYGTNLKGYLYINEVNSNKEVCSMPSKQQFRCNVYKDGTLVGSV